MKSVDELKQEQYDLKAKLHEIIEFINGEEFAGITPREKELVNQQRAGMEMYLDALTKRIYKSDEGANTSSMWLPLLMVCLLHLGLLHLLQHQIHLMRRILRMMTSQTMLYEQ